VHPHNRLRRPGRRDALLPPHPPDPAQTAGLRRRRLEPVSYYTNNSMMLIPPLKLLFSYGAGILAVYKLGACARFRVLVQPSCWTPLRIGERRRR
jgi:hypothetical protein